ncbi:DNA-3-methyladenine glycosylase family protein [Promicromonospora thailandica]|uniref:3-methyladenine DNA glycosylase/8-oxoguanine DNA glycosylase n=1 Tax=Promicromonospora thailandica TaxID=765201 RepID=A0A9X2GC07_9MICO|nr:DNA-3-methyladenine glycosylase 2 family protein [Promicromonospora thailandica]MCP2266994.1 3-methyladenine DNA glycosylase/8-oxoguanine DNA glycosylase [Promicromonospora thailandica]BFF16728.1 DNA-3-methyladenine glycosylase [Promicromonospora thailandica]
MLTVRHTSPRRLDVGLTLGPLGHGPADPTFHRAADGTLWRTSLLRSGPVTQRFVPAGPHAVVVHLWGDGAREAAEALPVLLGEDDDAAGFAPPPQVRDAHRRAAGMRIPRSGRVLEALVPAVLEQRVQTVTAHRAWRWLVRRYGTRAPGPAPAGVPGGLFVVPDARTWARVPVWDWHRAGVDPGRARTVTRCALVAPRLEEAAAMPRAEARPRLEKVQGVGVWTSAEVAQRAFGDADAVSVGDFHLPAAVGWALSGERTDDAGMLRLLAPYAPHRHRVVRLLTLSGRHRAPARGPRTPLVDHRAH